MASFAQTYDRPSKRIPAEHLLYMTGEHNYTNVFFADGSKGVFGSTLLVFERMYTPLFRISKHLLINPAKITKWKRVSAKYLWIEIADERFEVPRRRIKDVLNQLTAFQIEQPALAGG